MLHAFADGKIFGETFGTGPVRVVWLHGWARSHRDFQASASALAARGISSLALDLPGFGATPAPPVAGGARLYADLVDVVLGSLGTEPVVVVGHSFGGRVATVLAANHPPRVSALVLTGVPLLRRGGRSRASWPYRLIRAAHARGLLSEQRMESARQRYGSHDYRNASGTVRDVLVAVVNESYEDELRALQCPVALVWGERDIVVPVDVARAAQALVRMPVTLKVVSNVSHLLPTEASDELVASVLEVLA